MSVGDRLPLWIYFRTELYYRQLFFWVSFSNTWLTGKCDETKPQHSCETDELAPYPKTFLCATVFVSVPFFTEILWGKKFLVSEIFTRECRLNFRWKIGQITLKIGSFVFYHKYTSPRRSEGAFILFPLHKGTMKGGNVPTQTEPHHQIPVIAVPRHFFLPDSQQNLWSEPVYFLPWKTSQRQRQGCGLVVALAGLMVGLNDPCWSLLFYDSLILEGFSSLNYSIIND